MISRACATCLAIGIAWWGSGPIAFQGPNVLLVTIDTLRADRLGAYGYAQARTPAIDGLARRSVRFADATAHAVLTYPSHVAIMTGRYPGAFGVRLNGMDPLPASAVTAAERLKAAGYRTGAVVGSVIVDRSSGLSQGFDDYDDRIRVEPREQISKAELQRPAGEVTAAARKWIGAQQGAWFLWVHYYDPHLPYEAPAKFAAAAAGRPYDAEIAYTDSALGELLASVDPQRTAIVVTSDHGESLGEHGEPDHGFFLYDATLHVPLIVSAPGLAPRVVQEQVRSIDVVPTILELAGLRGDEADGESLVPLIGGGTRRDVPVSIAESWYPRLHFGWSELRSARVGEWKYVAAPKPELYDLRTDRQEARNVIGDRGSVGGRLGADIARVTSAWKAPDRPASPQPDAATIERLQALGYVGSLAPAASGSSTENPRDRIADYRAYRELFNNALGLLAQGQAAQAATALQRLVKLNVRAFEAHVYLGNAYAALGKTDAALGEYDAASILNPSISTPHFEAAKVLSTRGDAAAAAARCSKGLALDPQSAYGHNTLGVVYQKAGQWPEAAAAFGQAVELNPADPRAHANLAGASMRLGDLPRAATHYREMIELGYQVAPAQFNLGVIAARQGDQAEAERRYRLALKTDPAFKPAMDALKKLKQ
jgi:arylsulfatase A-like enzyme/Tfp pilus assembly protein PilF